MAMAKTPARQTAAIRGRNGGGGGGGGRGWWAGVSVAMVLLVVVVCSPSRSSCNGCWHKELHVFTTRIIRCWTDKKKLGDGRNDNNAALIPWLKICTGAGADDEL